jgi:hypothetical protein
MNARAVDHRSVTHRRHREAALLAYAALALAVAFYSARYHEPWRDETQAILVARATPLLGLLNALRYEMHPPLLFLLFKVTDRLLPPPYSLVSVGGLGFFLLLLGTDHLLRCFAPKRPRIVALLTLALGLTNTYAYLLGVIVRGYALGLGLGLLAAARLYEALGERRPRIATACVLAALAAATSVVTAVFVCALVAAFVPCFVMARRPLLRLWPLVFIAPPIAFCYWLSRPYEPRAYNYAYVPLPSSDITKTKALELLKSTLDYRHWWPVPGDAHIADAAVKCVALGLFLATCFGLGRILRNPARELFLPTAFWGGALAVLYLALFRFQRPGHHHTVYIVLPLLLLAVGWLVGADEQKRLRAALAWASLMTFLPCLAEQYDVGHTNFDMDRDNEFSHARALAQHIPDGARLISTLDYSATSIGYFRPSVVLRSPNMSGAYYSYVEWSKAESRRVAAEPLVQQECEMAPEKVFTLGMAASFRCLRLAAPVYMGVHAATNEYDNLYRVDCSCVGR